MIVRATVSTREGERYRLSLGEQISGPLGVLRAPGSVPDAGLQPGDEVIAAFFGSLADGVILGRDEA